MRRLTALGRAIGRWLATHARQLLALVLVVASIGLVVAGVAMIYRPAAFIVAGLALFGVLAVFDIDQLSTRPRRRT